MNSIRCGWRSLAALLTVSCLWIGHRTYAEADSSPKPENPAASILFLSTEPTFDAQYKTNLIQKGYAVASADLTQQIKPEFIRKFNVIVIDKTFQAGNQYEIFGQRTLTYWANLNLVWAALQDGAGVLVYPNLNDVGGNLSLGWNQDMKAFGISIAQASAIDLSREIYGWTAYGTNVYCWTTDIAKHPATEGLQRIYYAGGNARWDDCYLTPPLIVDTNWTVLIKGMPGSTAGVQVDREWVVMEDYKTEPILAAVRNVGKGRLAVFSLSPNYVHRHGYTRVEGGSLGEQSVGIIDGILLEKGDGKTPSDTGRFVMQLYRWLAADSAAGGLGGYRTGAPVEAADPEEIRNYQPVLNVETMTMPPSWKHRPTRVWRGDGSADYPELADPVVPGDIRFFKGLIGAHSKYSDGKGSVADYAQAARKAGYSLIAFTENFEKLSPAAYAELTAECEKNSSTNFACLPGFDIMDRWGNHFLVIAAPFYPRKKWLSEDGKRLVSTPYINLCYGNHIVVANRTTQGNVPVELLKHYQGFSVYTYRDGKLVEDASSNYAWQAESASMPHPIAVHEIFRPSEVAKAAKTGYQQILPADTVSNAVGYFRIGLSHFFDAPARYLLSEGPIATTWIGLPKDCGPASENRDFMRVDIAITNDLPLLNVELRDGFRTVRRWLPGTKTFAASTFFRHNRQYDLYVTARDEKGRGLLTSVLRTVPPRYHFRCSDRQNWLGEIAAWYPGTHLPYNLNMSLRGSDESMYTQTRGNCMAPKLNYPLSCGDLAILNAVLDQKYTYALRGDVGGDARACYATEPPKDWTGRVTTFAFTGKRLDLGVSLAEYDLTVKRDIVMPTNVTSGLLLTAAEARGNAMLWLKDGQIMATNLTGRADVDVPVNGLAGGFVALTPGWGLSGRSFGLRLPPLPDGRLKAGTHLSGKFLLTAHGRGVRARFDRSFATNEVEWMTQLGFLGKTPYELSVSKGKLDRTSFPIVAVTDEDRIEGMVTQAATNMFIPLPLEFRNLNPNWPIGIWREEAGIVYTGMYEGRAWPRLDVEKPGPFVAGHLVTADNRDVIIDVVVWNKDRLKLDVNNPTDKPMKVAIRTAKLPGLKSLEKTLDIPAGSSLTIE